MKKPRALTPEELRLWRESNRYTDKRRIELQDDEPEEVPDSALPVTKTMPIPQPRAANPKSLSPLKPLATREASKFFKPYGAVEAVLDLHGLTKLEAYERVQEFIRHVSRAGKRHVTIITGKGRSGEVGVLRSNLPHWLNEPVIRPLISGFATAHEEKGGHGVVHVLVKRLT